MADRTDAAASILRKGEREARVSLAFLQALCPVMLLTAAMMCDGAVAVMVLIRLFDTEEAPLAELCSTMEDLLDRISWLFHRGGCFEAPGHVTFIVEWLRTPHFYTINKIVQYKIYLLLKNYMIFLMRLLMNLKIYLTSM